MPGIGIGIGVGRFRIGGGGQPSFTIEVLNADSNLIVVTAAEVFSEPLPDKSAFFVDDHVIDSIALDGTKKILTLTLTTFAFYFDNMDVLYLKPVANPLINNGIEVDSFEQAVVNNITNYGMVARWDYDGNALDDSGNGKDLTNTNATLTVDFLEELNKAYAFDTGQFMNRTPFAESIIELFTVAFWYKEPSTKSNFAGLVSSTNPAALTQGFSVYSNNGTLKFFVNGWQLEGSANASSDDIPGDRWHFVTASYNKTLGSENLKLTLDDELFTDDYTDAIDQVGVQFLIGKSNTQFIGDISQIAFFDKELSLKERHDLYYAPLTIPMKWYDTFQRVTINPVYWSAYFVDKLNPANSVTVSNKIVVKNAATGMANGTIIQNTLSGILQTGRTMSEMITFIAEISLDTIETDDTGFGISIKGPGTEINCVWNPNDGKVRYYNGATLVSTSGGGLIGTDTLHYLITLTNNRWDLSFTITDIVTPANTYTYEFSLTPDEGANFGYSQAYVSMTFYNSVSNCNVYNVEKQINVPLNTRVHYIGDSNAYGYTLASFGSRFADVIHGGDTSQFAVFGNVGETSQGILVCMNDTEYSKAKYGVIQAGGNDADATGDYTMIRIPQLADACIDGGVIPIFTSIPNRPDWDVTVTNGRIADYCTANSIKYIDLSSLLDAGDGTLNPIYDEGDGYHLNVAGHAAVAALIVSEAPELIL